MTLDEPLGLSARKYPGHDGKPPDRPRFLLQSQ